MAAVARIQTHECFEINPMHLFRWEQTQDSHVLLYPEGVVKLSETAGEILKRCTGDKSVGQILEELKEIYSDSESTTTLEESLLQFLETSHARGWIRRKS